MTMGRQRVRPAACGRALATVSAVVLAATGLAGCDPMGGPVGNRAVPQPARPVEFSRYLGLWYELARYDNRFERGC